MEEKVTGGGSLKNEISICLIGCEKVGKTTLLKIWNNEGFDTVYSKTDEMYFKNINLDLNGRSLEVTIWDCPGSEFKNTRGTVDSYIANGPIHIFVLSKNDKGSVVFLKGFINSIFYRKSISKRKYIIVTNKKEEDCSEGLIDEVVTLLHSKRYDVDCAEGENVKNILNEIVTDYANEFFPKEEPKQNTTPPKKSCCSLF